MKRKIIIGISFLILFCIIGISLWKVPRVEEKTTPFLDHKAFQRIEKEEITSITKERFTEGGMEKEEIITKEDILSTYQYFVNKKIGEEVTTRCEDNTTIYIFHFAEGEDVTVEIECDWIIIGEKAYHWI